MRYFSMIDGIKCVSLSVSANDLLAHSGLTFGSLVAQQTGAILNPIQKATNRGLTFTAVPTKANPDKQRVELSGSLHRYGRGGEHNADDFTADDLRKAVEELACNYQIDMTRSTLNNVEFGVNLQLPFPVQTLLRALICYKGVPFTAHKENGFAYYQATSQRYALKLYDKGTQYNLTDYVLRVEIKVFRMEYLHRQNVPIYSLADLLNPKHYPALGRLLADAFDDILFDEPRICIDIVPTTKRELLLKGRNPRYWQQLDPSAPDYTRRRQQLRREKIQFRKLIADHRPSHDWQAQTGYLLRTKWQILTAVSGNRTEGELENICHKLTGVTADKESGQLSQINSNNVMLICDTSGRATAALHPSVYRSVGGVTALPMSNRKTVSQPANCRAHNEQSTITENSNKTVMKTPERRPTATDLRADPDLLAELERGRRKYTKGSQEDAAARAAHNLRNDESNPRNNLKRSINKIYNHPVLPFDIASTLRLTSDQQRRLSGSND